MKKGKNYTVVTFQMTDNHVADKKFIYSIIYRFFQTLVTINKSWAANLKNEERKKNCAWNTNRRHWRNGELQWMMKCWTSGWRQEEKVERREGTGRWGEGTEQLEERSQRNQMGRRNPRRCYPSTASYRWPLIDFCHIHPQPSKANFLTAADQPVGATFIGTTWAFGK